MFHRTARTLVRPLVVALLIALVGAIAQPARACACGAVISDDPRLTVSGETSIVRWDGEHEEIVLRMAVDSVRDDAALLLPTPKPARAGLGDRSWFRMLADASRPRTRHDESDWWPDDWFRLPLPGAGAPDGSARPDVTVHGETDVGPYHVASLSARDPHALAHWLKRNGYRLKGRVADGLAPYVKMGWHYTAVKLRATGHGDGLHGALTPLRVRFAAGSPVYPMRLSKAITADQHVRLYVLTPHRMRARTGGIAFATSYAGRMGQGYTGRLGEMFRGGTTFLTTLDGTARPGKVTGDVTLARTADTPYQRTVVVHRGSYVLGVVATGPFLVGASVLALALAVLVAWAWTAALRSRRRPGAQRDGRLSDQTGSSRS